MGKAEGSIVVGDDQAAFLIQSGWSELASIHRYVPGGEQTSRIYEDTGEE